MIGVTTDSSGNVIPIMSPVATHRQHRPGNADGGIGGRIIRVLPNGTVNTFAYGFDTSNAQDYTSFVNSSLTISFSADGTTLYASDDAGDLAIQDHGRPGRLDERHAGRLERPAHAGRSL